MIARRSNRYTIEFITSDMENSPSGSASPHAYAWLIRWNVALHSALFLQSGRICRAYLYLCSPHAAARLQGSRVRLHMKVQGVLVLMEHGLSTSWICWPTDCDSFKQNKLQTNTYERRPRELYWYGAGQPASGPGGVCEKSAAVGPGPQSSGCLTCPCFCIYCVRFESAKL